MKRIRRIIIALLLCSIILIETPFSLTANAATTKSAENDVSSQLESKKTNDTDINRANSSQQNDNKYKTDYKLQNNNDLDIKNKNLALDTQATASSTFPNKSWTPDKAIDGDTSGTDSRWSSKRATGTTNNGSDDKGTKEQWLMVDLGTITPINQINIYWESAYAEEYRVETSVDKINFTTAQVCKNGSQGIQTYRDLNIKGARYVRIYCLKPYKANWGYSIFEVEIYAKNRIENSKDVLDFIGEQAPTISNNGRINFPEVPDGYEISLYGSDNQQVISLDGTVIKPLVDMDVNILYKVKNSKTANDVATSNTDIKIHVPGKYDKKSSDNTKPNVLPGLREWKGFSGVYTRTLNSRIIVSDTSLNGAAQVIKTYFDQMLKINIPIVFGNEPHTGDIYLLKDGDINKLGNEGYMFSISDYVTITSPTVTGMTYGGASVTQILYQDVGKDNIPKGIARDYPKYKVRAAMLDVGRMYIPLDYLKEMTVYMSWFKMNEIHVHINDYWSGSGYSAFRLESDTYPQIVAKDGYYTKKDYRQYQKDMKKYGVDVITEIDTPYHAECFRNIPGVQMLAGKKGYLDITTDSARVANEAVIEKLFDEYLDGSDPVIQSKNFHIGTDEYDKKYSEQMREWTDHFINYVNDKGYSTRLWASLGKNGFNGTTPVSNNATMNLWAPYWADVREIYEDGYNVINTYGGWLYIVPGGNAGYPDRLDLKNLYNNFEVNNFKSGRNPSGETIMPVAEPQTQGAEFCVWNDMTSYKTGFSWFDIFSRFKDGVMLVSEKTWFGDKQADQTYDQFEARITTLGNKVPNANPERYVDSESKKVACYSFTQDGRDLSENGYQAKLVNSTIQNGMVTKQKDGYISLPFKSIGYPYTVKIKINLSDINNETTLFTGADGVMYANIDNSGKIGFKRNGYRFCFNYKIPENESVVLTFVGNNTETTLYVNGINKGTAHTMVPTIGNMQQKSSTFIMPFEKILYKAKGSLDDLEIFNYAMNSNEVKNLLNIASRDNLAVNKNVTVSGLEVDDGRFTADKAVDGEVSSDSRVSFSKNSDIQWMMVDLGKNYTISEFLINYETQAPQYKLQVSSDGNSFADVYTFTNDTFNISPPSGVQKISIKPIEARYIKYIQLKRFKNASNGKYYSGSIYEFEVYEPFRVELARYTQDALNELHQYTSGVHNGDIEANFYKRFEVDLNFYSAFASNDNKLTESDFLNYKQNILDKEQELSEKILVVKQDAIDAYNYAKSLNSTDYTSTSYRKFKKYLSEISLENLTTVDQVNEVIQKINNAISLLSKEEDKSNHQTSQPKINMTYVSDTTQDFSVNGAYQFKITSTNSQTPIFVVGTPDIFNVELVQHIGTDYYFKITAIGAPGDKVGIYVNGVKLLVATVGSNPNYVKLDTGKQLSVRAGKTYQFRVTAAKRPTFICGTGSTFRVTYVNSKGNDYFFKVTATGKVGDRAGFYVNSEKAPRTIGTIIS